MSRPKHHLANGRFRNNAELNNHSSLLKFLRWQWQSPRVERIAFPIDRSQHEWVRGNRSESSLTWLGHASFLLQHQGFNLLTDPVLSERASPSQRVGPKRTTAPAMSLAELPEIDIVVISHDHYDHLDKNTVRGLAKQQAQSPLFVVPLKLGQWLSQQGIDHWVELDWWQSHEHRGWQFHAVPVQHFSGRGTRPNNTLWAGFVIDTPEDDRGQKKRIFFAGDSGYSDDFKQIAKQFKSIDLALIPIGAYEPRWFMRDMHMNPEEAVQVHIDLQAKRSIAMHWGTFVLTDEAMDEPPKKLNEAKAVHGIQDDAFITLQHGQTLRGDL
ncbi:nape-hyDrolyzing phospholipase d [gamma proteobacterium HTCC5015]|nr:nape-hyDrolyzing phospholipase d [gamma proteobacterium HTCC5015]